MSSIRIAIPACAALAIALSACSGPTSASNGSDVSEAVARNENAVMSNATDGSAARAVGDMMDDPAIRSQMGLAPAPGPTPASSPTIRAEAATIGSDGIDPSQVRALAMCRILRGGTPHAVTQADVSAAQTELAADPNALGQCHAGM